VSVVLLPLMLSLGAGFQVLGQVMLANGPLGNFRWACSEVGVVAWLFIPYWCFTFAST